MSANADYNRPLGLLNAFFVRLRMTQIGDCDRLFALNLGRRTMLDEDRLAAPLESFRLKDAKMKFENGAKRSHLSFGNILHLYLDCSKRTLIGSHRFVVDERLRRLCAGEQRKHAADAVNNRVRQRAALIFRLERRLVRIFCRVEPIRVEVRKFNVCVRRASGDNLRELCVRRGRRLLPRDGDATPRSAQHCVCGGGGEKLQNFVAQSMKR